jgi:GNAT superfamily N-acetyltransferase
MEPIQFLLVDGQVATIRLMTMGDTSAIDAMHDRLSKQSLYYRYFVTYKPSLAMLHEQIRLAQCRGAALVASLDSSRNEVIGMAYYLRTQTDTKVGEVAMLVEDRFQSQGLGRALFDRLTREAQSQALRRLQLFILPDNRRMLNILRPDKFPMQRQYREGMLKVELYLQSQNLDSSLATEDC